MEPFATIGQKAAQFVHESQESCPKKAIVASVAGVGLGVGFGTFLGTFEGAHGEIVGQTTREQLRYGFGKAFKASYDRSLYFAKHFSVIGLIFVALECPLERERAKHDIINPILAGGATGALLGAWNAKKLPIKELGRHTVKGAVSFALFTAAIESAITYFRDRED